LETETTTVSFTLEDTDVIEDKIYFNYKTELPSSIVSFSAENATYDTSDIDGYGERDNLYTDYEIILTPTGEDNIVITMTVYSNHESNSQSYSFGTYIPAEYVNGYVAAPEYSKDIKYLGSDAI
jgi:hypothetical protein